MTLSRAEIPMQFFQAHQAVGALESPLYETKEEAEQFLEDLAFDTDFLATQDAPSFDAEQGIGVSLIII